MKLRNENTPRVLATCCTKPDPIPTSDKNRRCENHLKRKKKKRMTTLRAKKTTRLTKKTAQRCHPSGLGLPATLSILYIEEFGRTLAADWSISEPLGAPPQYEGHLRCCNKPGRLQPINHNGRDFVVSLIWNVKSCSTLSLNKLWPPLYDY